MCIILKSKDKINIIKAKCGHCGKEIKIDVSGYDHYPQSGFSCNSCVDKNSPARNGVDESTFTEVQLHNKLYYAHHIWKYDMKIEKYELELIEQQFPYSEIINPNGYVKQDKTESEIMQDCFNFVDKCEVLVFSSMLGVVGKGVVDEVLLAKKQGKKLYYLNNGSIQRVYFPRFKIIKPFTSNVTYAVVK